jgi:AAA+ superfamily predicted ATPase
LTLAQKLWDEPNDVLRLADPFHPLFRNGLVAYVNRGGHFQTDTGWDAPFSTPSLVASQLLYPTTLLPQGLSPVVTDQKTDKLSETEHIVSLRLRTEGSDGLRVVPVLGVRGSSRREAVQAIAGANNKQLCEFKGDAALLSDQQYLNSLATICWLRDSYLFFSADLPLVAAGEKSRADALTLPSSTIPATVFLAAEERIQLASLPQHLTLPSVKIPPSTYQERRDYWKQNLGAKARGLDKLIAECARRFRFEKETILAICEELKELPGKVTEQEFVAACRAEVESDIGELAGRVVPRFEKEDLVLPHKQHLQFEEILGAMRALTEVHYTWGTGKVWNEAGISVLFAGPPGTGKTMAAEILAVKLDLPMYRIDLSQVVNKYIGETEKNLKRVFDAADLSDIILFFDEADSLFGRRTEVSDAHDRYANLEISYLLERMERFKGLAILATNRKKDLDEAFLRRLRYVVDFPLPDVAERKRIWRQVIPERADSSQLDLDFLAHQFPLAGGNIRSIVFNACLQSANGSSANGKAGALSMDEVIVAIKREYDKLNRTLSLEQYGAHASLVEGLEHEQEQRTH